MFGFLKKPSYGIQIHDGGLKFTAITTGKLESIQLQQLDHIELDSNAIRNGRLVDEQVLVSALQKLKERLSLQKINVHLTIPTTNFLMRRTRVASLSQSEMKNLIDLELHSGDKLPFKNPMFDFVRIESHQLPSDTSLNEKEAVKQEEVLVFATPEDSVLGYVQALQLCGITVESVDVAPLALYRLMTVDANKNSRELPRLFLLLECTSVNADVAIFADGIPVFIRSISLPPSSAFESPAERKEQYLTSLMTELSRIMNYYKFSISSDFSDVTHLVFCGDAMYRSELAKLLNEEQNVTVEDIQLDFIADSDLNLSEEQQKLKFATALGLALKGLRR